MAKLNGILPIEGTVGRITFVTTEEGIIVKEKSSKITAQRVATDPAFELTRLNNAEFGDAGRASKLLFAALRTTIRAKADSRASSRLTRLFMQALHADPASDRGLRRVATGTPAIIQGFEFNRHALLSTVCSAPFTTTITRTSGDIAVSIPAFIPLNELTPPDGATHFRLSLTGVECNFTDFEYVAKPATSSMLSIDGAATTAITLTAQVTAASVNPLVAVLSISFYQDTNGTPYLMRNKASNAMSIVKVDV